MNKNNEPEKDAALSSTLRAWRIDAVPSPGFENQVWRRIAQAEVPAPTAFARVISFCAQAVSKPAVAFAYCALLVGVGVGLGYVQSGQAKNDARDQFQSLYLQSVNPYFQSERHL